MATFLRVAGNEAVRISEITGFRVTNIDSSSVELFTESNVYEVNVSGWVDMARAAKVIDAAAVMSGSSVSWKQADDFVSEVESNTEKLNQSVKDFKNCVKDAFKSVDDFFAGK